jgi:N-acetylglucosamine-6-sulfatase
MKSPQSTQRSRRKILSLCSLCVLWFSFFLNAAETRPNIVFILSDDQRYDSLGVVGNREVKTPNLDAFAKEGIVFSNATVCVPLCAPSRASLLTGLLPHQHGYFSNKSWNKDAARGFVAPTAMELLRDSGYRTVLIGKWHIDPPPWKCGFDEIRTWMPQGADEYVGAKLAHGKSDKVKENPGHVTEIFTDDAVEFLREVAAGKNTPPGPPLLRGGKRERDAQKARDEDFPPLIRGDKGGSPFFLWLAYTAPHTPQKPVPEHINALYADMPRGARPPGFPPGEPTPAPWAKYYGAISHMDEQIGRVLKAIDDAGLRENTVVFFLGDNGWMMGSHGYHGKIIPLDESIRVPLVVRGPKASMGWTGASPALVSSLDLAPAWLELAGVKVPAEFAGQSMLPLLRDENAGADFRRDVFCEFEDEKEWPGEAYRLVRTHDWKYVLRPPRSEKELKSLSKKAEKKEEEKDRKPPDLARERLYNLKADPHELKDLMGEAGTENALQMLRERTREWMERTGDPALNWLEGERKESKDKKKKK